MGRPSKYPEEFREAAVEMVRETGMPIAAGDSPGTVTLVLVGGDCLLNRQIGGHPEVPMLGILEEPRQHRDVVDVALRQPVLEPTGLNPTQVLQQGQQRRL